MNLRGLDATAPLPLIYPDFDDPLVKTMRREVELLFDTIVPGEDSKRPRAADRRLHVSSTSGSPSTTASRTSTAANSGACRFAGKERVRPAR